MVSRFQFYCDTMRVIKHMDWIGLDNTLFRILHETLDLYKSVYIYSSIYAACGIMNSSLYVPPSNIAT